MATASQPSSNVPRYVCCVCRDLGCEFCPRVPASQLDLNLSIYTAAILRAGQLVLVDVTCKDGSNGP
jgi:hypothetical protein